MNGVYLMNEMVNSGITEASTEPSSPSQLTAGAMLRRAREAAGLHVAALAVSMKIPVKKLEALEADRLDLLLDIVFVRALAGSVCRALKIDPGPVLEKLPQTSAPRLNSGESGINAPFRVPGESTSLSIPAFFAKPRVLVVVALLIAAVFVVLLPDIQTSTAFSEREPPVDQATVKSVAPPEVVDAEVQAQSGANTTPDLTPIGTVSTGPENSAVSNPVVSSATVEPTTDLAAGVIVFKAKESSWVEVVDAKGAVQIRRILSAGESVGASGALPLSAVVGRVDAVDVEVRGRSFNLNGIARDNVARFEVK